MTDKTEAALDLDGLDLARPPWRYCDQTQTIFGNSDKGEHYVAMIRGWGHYTGNGHGALGLPSDVAIEVQQAIGLRISKLPELEALVAAQDARIRGLERESESFLKIFAAASDLRLSLCNEDYAKIEPPMKCQRVLATAMNEHENEFMQEDCRNLAS